MRNFWVADFMGEPGMATPNIHPHPTNTHPPILISPTSVLEDLPCKYLRIMSVTEKSSGEIPVLGKEGLLICDDATWREFNEMVMDGLPVPEIPEGTVGVALILGEDHDHTL
jgi:hypothetical protein